MSSTFTIELNHLRFFATHGHYEEEGQAGNEFEVNITLTVEAPKTVVTSLDEVINYAEVYRISKEIFLQRKALLETIAMEIADELKRQFPGINELAVQIVKVHPPVTAFIGSVAVTYKTGF